jgi:hypothetical protein
LKIRRYADFAASGILDTKTGVPFDLAVTGTPQLYSWTKPDSDIAFLVYDRDEDGQITSGKELFGNHTVSGLSNGFAALRVLGDVQWGYIDASHGGTLWSKLKLWHDRNQDGISQPDELEPVSNVLSAIGLGYTVENRRDGAGNLYRYRSWARMKDGTEFAIYDAILTAPK